MRRGAQMCYKVRTGRGGGARFTVVTKQVEKRARMTHWVGKGDRAMATKRAGVACYDRAGEDEPLFVLRAQDVLAAGVVREWADRAERGGTKAEIVAEARKVAEEMEAWPFHKHPGTSVERHAAR